MVATPMRRLVAATKTSRGMTLPTRKVRRVAGVAPSFGEKMAAARKAKAREELQDFIVGDSSEDEKDRDWACKTAGSHSSETDDDSVNTRDDESDAEDDDMEEDDEEDDEDSDAEGDDTETDISGSDDNYASNRRKSGGTKPAMAMRATPKRLPSRQIRTSRKGAKTHESVVAAVASRAASKRSAWRRSIASGKGRGSRTGKRPASTQTVSANKRARSHACAMAAVAPSAASKRSARRPTQTVTGKRGGAKKAMK